MSRLECECGCTCIAQMPRDGAFSFLRGITVLMTLAACRQHTVWWPTRQRLHLDRQHYHCSASPVLTVTGFVNGRGQFSTPPHNFWVVNRRFQAKQIQYWKFHIIETTASISTKFCTTETIKRSSWVVPIRAINPRWRTVMKFGTVTVMHIKADRPLKI